MSNSKSPVGELRQGQDRQTDEMLLLLAMLDLALTNIDIAISAANSHKHKGAATPCLMRAVETYGSVKNLLPKLELRPEQLAAVHARLESVRQRLWSGPRNSPLPR